MTGVELGHAVPGWCEACDVVVVGSGAAGLAAAHELLASGLHAVVVTRADASDSSTDWAQGGLAAVWAPDDTPEGHVADTLEAGAGLCDPASVRTLVDEAPGALRRLMGLGAVFDRTAKGTIDLHLEGGHHTRRILHAGGDRSGHEVETTLVRAVSRLHREAVLTGHRLVDVLTDEHGAACGVRLAGPDGGIGELHARAVVLATGGIGRLWPTTTNPEVATGDGLAAGLRAGALARDVEFMQFHPTVLVPPHGHDLPDGRRVLVSEAVRGEGAVLVDLDGTRVMAGVHPLADLAPRDVVSATVQQHLARTHESFVLLDATGFGERTWQDRFPSILAMCRERGVDPVREPIPVRPGAHYHCGGIAATMDGTTHVPGLFAVGEVACTGVQGANRLASNSLTEALVTGRRVARLLGADLPSPGKPLPRPVAPSLDRSGLPALRGLAEEHAGVLRDEAGLRALADGVETLPATHGPLDDACLDATNLGLVAAALAATALTRRESRGCHRRSDHPHTEDAWRRHLDAHLDDGGRAVVHDGPSATPAGPADRVTHHPTIHHEEMTA